ncbi:MAG: hypothetical protein AAF267_07180 [Deinococcota bacterium]
MEQTLLTRLNKERKALRGALDGKPVDEAVSHCQDLLKRLGQNYLQDVPSRQVEQTSLVLELLIRGLEHTLAANQVELWQPYTPTDERAWLRIDMPIVRRFARLRGLNPGRLVAQGLVFTTLLVFLILQVPNDPLLFIAIGLLALLGYISVAPAARQAANPDADMSPRQLQQEVRLDVDMLLASLTKTCDSFDRFVKLLQETPANTLQPVTSFQLTEQTDVLELLQSLAEANTRGQAELALARSSDVRGLLKRHGLELVDHTEVDVHNLRDIFELEPSLDLASRDYRTLRPALVDGSGKLLLRGRVIEPQTSAIS